MTTKTQSAGSKPRKTAVIGKKTSTKTPAKREKVAASVTIQAPKDFEVKAFCQRYKIIRPDLTRLTGYSLRAVDKWAAGEKPAAPAKKQLAELVRLFDALADLMENEDVGPWLKAPNPAFANSTPLQVIERGETDRIWRMIYQLETGEPA